MTTNPAPTISEADLANIEGWLNTGALWLGGLASVGNQDLLERLVKAARPAPEGVCFECGHDLHAPFCPACNPEIALSRSQAGWRTDMSREETEVLKSLAEYYWREGSAKKTAYIVSETGLPDAMVRLALKSLALRGYAEFRRGLWTEEGEMWGSGYSCTKAGNEALPAPPVNEGA